MGAGWVLLIDRANGKANTEGSGCPPLGKKGFKFWWCRTCFKSYLKLMLVISESLIVRIDQDLYNTSQ